MTQGLINPGSGDRWNIDERIRTRGHPAQAGGIVWTRQTLGQTRKPEQSKSQEAEFKVSRFNSEEVVPLWTITSKRHSYEYAKFYSF